MLETVISLKLINFIRQRINKNDICDEIRVVDEDDFKA